MTPDFINPLFTTYRKNGWLFACAVVALAMIASPLVSARDGAAVTNGLQRYIVELQDPPLAAYRGQPLSTRARDGSSELTATTRRATGESKLSMNSPQALAYLGFIAARHEEFKTRASQLLGRSMSFAHQYRVASNGMALDLSPAEAEILAKSPLVISLAPDTHHWLDTYAGPQWIGAEELWTGSAGFAEKRGEGIIVGVIDTGINWEHPSFDNPSIDGYLHTNPFGSPRGLCADSESSAQCNDKLIGIYDFVVDDPSTEDVIEGSTDGKDDDGHGSHTASLRREIRLEPCTTDTRSHLPAWLPGPTSSLIVSAGKDHAKLPRLLPLLTRR
jgi:subtilisin family serine protease